MKNKNRIAAGLVLSLAFALTSQSALAGQKYTRNEVDYKIPSVYLYNQDGKKIKLDDFLEKSDKVVIVDFIYATCTTICPVLSAGFTNFQKKSGMPTTDVRLVSFSIDPENDTPEVMKEYLDKYGAKEGWDFLTGSREDIDKVMRAFNAYVPDKMNHMPLSFYKGPGKDKWVRIYGLIGISDMLKEYKGVLGK